MVENNTLNDEKIDYERSLETGEHYEMPREIEQKKKLIKDIENERKMEKGWMVIKGNQQEQHINCGCWSAQFVG